MKHSFLEKSFFEEHTLDVAEHLIGCYLIRSIGQDEMVLRITETEAYRGADDPASHAHRGPTPRNQIMFGEPGRIYVYLSYGIHYCMNMVTEPQGQPGAVLIRGAQCVQGAEYIRRRRPGVKEALWLNGPGKLTRALDIDLTFNGYDLYADDPNPNDNGTISLLSGEKDNLTIHKTPRIGISRGQEFLWRFIAE
jgi:DNA-3-methyladenine glycosylase